MIKPFKHIQPTLQNKIATRKWVVSAMRKVLTKLHITGEGIELLEKADGQLHLKVNVASADPYHPFKAETIQKPDGGIGITIRPGLIYCSQLPDYYQTRWMLPQIQNVDLRTEYPPWLNVSGIKSIIVIVAEFDIFGQAINLPWQIKAFAEVPADTPLIRNNNTSGTPQNGKYHILLASIKDGVIYQWIRRNVTINLQWQKVFIVA